jgi:hypothetical protein
MKTVFDFKGFVHTEFVQKGQTINRDYYVEILKRLHEAVRTKVPGLWPNDWILHHDNALGNTALSIKQFLAQKSIIGTEHPSYFTDLAPNDFWLFSKIKSALKGRRFQDIEISKKKKMKEGTKTLKAIPQLKF